MNCTALIYISVCVCIITSNTILARRPIFYSNVFTLLKLAASHLNLNFRLIMFYFNFSYLPRFRSLFYRTLRCFNTRDRIWIVRFNRRSGKSRRKKNIYYGYEIGKTVKKIIKIWRRRKKKEKAGETNKVSMCKMQTNSNKSKWKQKHIQIIHKHTAQSFWFLQLNAVHLCALFIYEYNSFFFSLSESELLFSYAPSVHHTVSCGLFVAIIFGV